MVKKLVDTEVQKLCSEAGAIAAIVMVSSFFIVTEDGVDLSTVQKHCQNMCKFDFAKLPAKPKEMVAKHLKDGADEDRPGKGKKEKKSSKNSTDKDKGQERKEPKEKSVEDKKSKKVKNKKKNKIFQRADLVWRWLQSLVWDLCATPGISRRTAEFKLQFCGVWFLGPLLSVLMWLHHWTVKDLNSKEKSWNNINA